MFIIHTVDLPSTALGWNREKTDRTIACDGRFGWANLQRYAAQAAHNSLKSLILAQIERWRHG